MSSAEFGVTWSKTFSESTVAYKGCYGCTEPEPFWGSHCCGAHQPADFESRVLPFKKHHCDLPALSAHSEVCHDPAALCAPSMPWKLRKQHKILPALDSSSFSVIPLAKQKLEDRLAAAAREKLAQASKESKEKQLQAERKRKAALFLQTLKNPLPEAEVGKIEESPFSVEVC